MNVSRKGVLIAAAAATLILSGNIAARAADQAGSDMVHCAGINECKGHGSCAGAGHSCAGKNGCKGQGFVKTTKDDCTQKGGKVIEPESK